MTYNELNGSDSFVLDEVTIVRVWIPFGANEHKQNRAIVLGKRILENDSNLKSDTTNLIVAIGQYLLVYIYVHDIKKNK